MSVQGFCQDLRGHPSVSAKLVAHVTSLLHNHLQEMNNKRKRTNRDDKSNTNGMDVTRLLEYPLDGLREAQMQAFTSPQQRARTDWYFHDICRLLDCMSVLQTDPCEGVTELQSTMKMSLVQYFQMARDVTGSHLEMEEEVQNKDAGSDESSSPPIVSTGVASFEKFSQWVRTRSDGGQAVCALLGIEENDLSSYEAFVTAM